MRKIKVRGLSESKTRVEVSNFAIQTSNLHLGLWI